MSEAYNRAVALLRRNRTRYGFTASSSSQHIRSADGVIAALAALLTDDPILREAAGDTLDTLAQFQGPHGEIAHYIDLDTGTANYGDVVGCVDGLLWFCIGCARYSMVMRNRQWLQQKSAAIQKALFLAGAWQYNDRGLIYVPQGRLYPDSGYLLTEQVLYSLTLQLLTAALDTANPGVGSPLDEAPDDRSLVEVNYWPTARHLDHPRLYHRAVFQRQVEQDEKPYFLGNLTPRGYHDYFDGLGNALALLAGMGQSDQVERLIDTVTKLAQGTSLALPPVYHFPSGNGKTYDVWPIIGAWWAAAIAQRRSRDRAQTFVNAVHAANMIDGGRFAEHIQPQSAQAGGLREASISAAASIFAEMALQGVYPFG